jgi:hypothetical protein
MRSDRSTHCCVPWHCGTEHRVRTIIPMDSAQLRRMLEPLGAYFKDAGTHTVLPTLCEESDCRFVSMRRQARLHDRQL